MTVLKLRIQNESTGNMMDIPSAHHYTHWQDNTGRLCNHSANFSGFKSTSLTTLEFSIMVKSQYHTNYKRRQQSSGEHSIFLKLSLMM